MATSANALEPIVQPVSVSTDVSADEWNRYVSTHTGATGYHAWGWKSVFERAFGHETRYLAARRRGTVVGVLPLVLFRSPLFGRFMVSLPFVNYGGLICDDDAAGQALVEAAVDMARGGGFAHVELRHVERQLHQLPVKQHKVTMLMSLAASREQAWTTLDRKVRNQIRKAEKSGLTAALGGVERLDAFYRIFARNMRDLGTPVYDRRFFEEVLTAFPDRAQIVVVEKEGVAVAAGIGLVHRGTIEVPWASSLSEFRSLCPNHMLYWSVIQWGIDHGMRLLDFGRSTPNEGTYQFKQQWGAEPTGLSWEYCLLGSARMPDQSPKNPRFRLAIEAWKRCPLWLANTVGPHLVRSIP
jgi:serine/alanine adding enzyme